MTNHGWQKRRKPHEIHTDQTHPARRARACGRSSRSRHGGSRLRGLAAEPSAIPDPAVEILDPSFRQVPRSRFRAVERLATGFRWAEGPVWFGDGRCLLWSDIPNNRIMRWDEETGEVSVFRKPSNNANGNTRDRQGRLVTCEHGTPACHPHRVRRHDHGRCSTGSTASRSTRRTTSSASPTARSGSRDPPFGILGYYEGTWPKPELPTNVYRVDRKTGKATRGRRRHQAARTASLLARRERSSTSSKRARRRRVIRGLRRRRRRHCGLPTTRVFIDCGARHRPTASAPTSTAISGAAGAWAKRTGRRASCFNPDGKLIGRIQLPERCANLCFGGVQPQPAVHGRQHVALLALRQHAGRRGRLSRVCRCRVETAWAVVAVSRSEDYSHRFSNLGKISFPLTNDIAIMPPDSAIMKRQSQASQLPR